MQSVAGCLAMGGIAGCAVLSASAVCTFCDRPVWSGSSTVCGRIGLVEAAVWCVDDELLLSAVVVPVRLFGGGFWTVCGRTGVGNPGGLWVVMLLAEVASPLAFASLLCPFSSVTSIAVFSTLLPVRSAPVVCLTIGDGALLAHFSCQASLALVAECKTLFCP